jgi:hypothetical protein
MGSVNEVALTVFIHLLIVNQIVEKGGLSAALAGISAVWLIDQQQVAGASEAAPDIASLIRATLGQ